MEHLYIVCYDIRDDKRWRRLYKLMRGHGEWVQLSVFQCRLDRMKFLRLQDAAREIIDHEEDHVLFFDLGPADGVRLRVESLGIQFTPVERRPVIV